MFPWYTKRITIEECKEAIKKKQLTITADIPRGIGRQRITIDTPVNKIVHETKVEVSLVINKQFHAISWEQILEELIIRSTA